MDSAMTTPMLSRLPRGYRNDRRLGLIYDQRPSSADDLTQIAGIETREAVILNRLGVYFIAQIALWRPFELTAFAQELQMSPERLADERWIEQARCGMQSSVVRPAASSLPASILRTAGVLACALLIGFLVVYLVEQRRSAPLQGVLSAEMTSLKVPDDARLIAAHVRPGDEVFSGAPLLTLEKDSHVLLIAEQERRVSQLQQDLQQAEARANLELAWRVRDVEREVVDARNQMAAIQDARRRQQSEEQDVAARPTGAAEPAAQSASARVKPVPGTTVRRAARAGQRSGGLVFFAGATGESTQLAAAKETGLPPLPTPPRVAMATTAPIVEPDFGPVPVTDSVADLLVGTQLRGLESLIERLETMQTALPDQVRQAAGIDYLRQQLTTAAERLEDMKSVNREVAITAPAYGVIGQVRFREGDSMPAGEVMLKILHTDRRFVVVYVPTRRVTELQQGNEVGLTFPGGELYEGRVTDLPMLADVVTPGGESLVAVRLEPAGRLWPQVPIGSQIDVVLSP